MTEKLSFNHNQSLISLINELYPDRTIIETTELHGLSNNISLIKFDNNQKFIVRINNTTNLHKEIQLVQVLAQHNQTLGVAKTFPNGYITPYIEGSILNRFNNRTPDILIAIAKKLYQLHQCTDTINTENVVFTRMNTWLDHLTEYHPNKTIILEMKSELDALKYTIDQENITSGILCHNDLPYENILINENTIMFIDWEYAGHNYPLYDIANFFREWSGNELNDSQLLSPNEEIIFLNAYYNNNIPTNTNHHLKLMLSLSDLHWSIWGLYQSVNSKIDFDYNSYASKRFVRYLKHTHNV